MEDSRIIELYFARDEAAIAETAKKYGAYCLSVAGTILPIREDAEECVNETYHQAWRAIPPARPTRLRLWLGKITRNLALNRWNRDHAQKRGGGTEVLLSELADCLPAPDSAQRHAEDEEIRVCLEAWLRALSREDRALFLRRYWYGEALKSLAAERRLSPEKLAQKMYRLRQSLKAALEQEGIWL